MKDEIILYRPDELAEHIEVRIDEKTETIWLTQQQIADLFGTQRPAITKHLGNIFKSGELKENVVSSILEHTTPHGAIKGKTQNVKVKYYNIDAVLSVGYRVNSVRATQFRIWANRVLKDYLLKGYAINNRMNRIEDKVDSLSNKINEIDLQINTHLIPNQGVFFDGQVFDAYELASKIIRSAKKNIVLIDNYIDESTLTHLSKKTKAVKVLLLTKTISKQLTLDVKKANEQYSNFELKTFTKSHDRFLIIDHTDVYHLGASLKDLGKKWFAFSKMDKNSVANILNEIAV
ncbi:virulence RhuM family protein [Paenimyroides aestuarii]|uniref:Virulence RhuM family protein n=1 Tax=Paenimyroides aestuarii TaxID=2968490 RepID=A0ABY5NNR9_9FLAO|nr:RhuM family protein [Paenimyroides aestuarii]UUV20178.1 virulence RhuM family protein [Paenimyroides aestuarii]